MNYLLYSITVLLVLIWGVSVLFFNAGALVHLLLLIALLCVVGGIFVSDSSTDDNNMRTL